MKRIPGKPLKAGDIVVKVRKLYQNYDHTLIPTEPKIYTFKKQGCGGIYLEEVVPHAFMKDKTKYVSDHGWDNGLFFQYCERLEDYLSGNYNKDIILDKKKWDSLESFLLFKMVNDYEIALKKEAARWK